MNARRTKTATATRIAAGTTAIIAAVASQRHHICKIALTCYAFADTATAAVADSATTFTKQLMKDGNGSGWNFDFGEDGIACAAGSAVNLVTATADSSVVVTVTYWTS